MDTVELWVRRCAARMDDAGLYFGHGTDNALDEAAWLVLHVLGAPLDGNFDAWNSKVGVGDTVRIQALLDERISSRQPLAYLLGEAWFCGLPFRVGPGALVPRSPIAELILDGFQPWLGNRLPTRALDLCTGSGCIAVAMARKLPGLHVDASDISAAALDIAAQNVRMHGLETRLTLHEADLFKGLEEQRYDLIVTNPPYVPRAVLRSLPDEYRAEPELGLVSGDDGLELPLRILHEAPAWLARDGLLFCEVGESDERLQATLETVPLTWLEFEHGGSGVFTIDRQQLEAARPVIRSALERRGHVTE